MKKCSKTKKRKQERKQKMKTKKTKKKIAIFGALIALMFIASPLTLSLTEASTDGSNNITTALAENPDGGKNRPEIKPTDEGLEIESIDEDGNGYWLNIIGTKSFFKFKYISDGSIQDDTQFKLMIFKAIEYQDTNKNGVFDIEDQVLHEFLLGGQHPDGMGQNKTLVLWDYTLESIEIGGLEGWKIVMNTNDTQPESSFEMSIVLWIFQETTEYEGYTIDAFTVKIDFLFLDIPWTASDSNLALKVFMKSEQNYRYRSHMGDDIDKYENKNMTGVSTNPDTNEQINGYAKVYFSWINTADLKTKDLGTIVKTVPVNSTEIEHTQKGDPNVPEGDFGGYGKGIDQLYLCYPHFDSEQYTLVHDPIIGVETVGGQITNIVIGVAVILSIIAVAIVLIKRR